MDYTKFPIVEVSVALSSKKIKTTCITDFLQVRPSKERGVEDWPDSIKENSNLPEQMKPRNEWVWSIEYERCTNIDDALKNLIAIFSSKNINIC
ncbi:hypothetical protein [Enterococcus sp. AZ196]|uniref:hypothetical protein n=1 Tax=Enterococcus sp. AZ196 TaxID=2774659 RepID=UPI003D2A616C